MNKDFRMEPANSAAAMERIIETLTEPQQMALVVAMQQAGHLTEVIQVTANERTIGSLLRGNGQLIREVGRKRVLTPLGRDVARYLTGTRSFDTLPDMDDLLPPMPDQT